MASYDQIIKVSAIYVKDAKQFFNFFKKVGHRYTRPVKIKYKYLGRGRFYVIIDGESGAIDAFFQELIMNRGLYYYGCTLQYKKKIIRNVVTPIFRQFIDKRFTNPQSRFLRKHILGKYSQKDFVPTDIKNKLGYEVELLFRRWDLKAISSKNYIIDLDAILHQFLLEKINHKAGSPSKDFSHLLNMVKVSYVMPLEVEEAFNSVHSMRTWTLHRLELQGTSEEIEGISNRLLNFFRYIDDYEESQKIKTIKIRGKRFKRIKYGDEKWVDEKGLPYLNEDGSPIDWLKITTDNPCHDCSVHRGYYHVEGCDVEICPKCGGQFISFDCGVPN